MLTKETVAIASELLAYAHETPGQDPEPKWNWHNTVEVNTLLDIDARKAAGLQREVSEGRVRLRLYRTDSGRWHLGVPNEDLAAWEGRLNANLGNFVA